MKQLLCVVALFVAATAFAQEKEADTEGKFIIKGVTGLNVSQTAMSNWSAGGENSFAGTAYLNATGERKSGKWLWTNSLALEYGLTKVKSQGTRKVSDKIEFTTKLGHQMSKKWYYAGLIDFKSQFATGYDYSDDGKGPFISKFMAPAYSNVSLGMEYRPNEILSVYLSPITEKFTFVLNDSLSDAGAFGVDTGDKIKAEAGAYVKARFQKEIVTNVSLISTLDLFTAYNSSFGDVDINWDILINMKVNKFLSANINATLKYDNDVKTVDSNGNARGAKVQLKEVIGVGVAYNF